MSQEIASELANITACPAPCDDGMVEVFPASFRPRKVPCPVISLNCARGIRMGQELEHFLVSVMTAAGVPLRYLENFSRCRESPAVEKAREWPMRGFLVFCGKSGTGKSFGAAFAVHEYLRSRILNLLDRKTWENVNKIGVSTMMWYSAADIVGNTSAASRAKKEILAVIDDLGKEGDSSNGLTAIRSVISKRYDAKLPTVITTSLTMAGIDARYGRYIVEKIVEDVRHGGKIVDCGDVSMRPRSE
jgi:hypothetical protein